MPKTIGKVTVAYKKAASSYDLMNKVYFFGMDKRFRSMLAERLNPKPGDSVLDLCCGTGLDFPFLIEKIKNQGTLLGVDLSLEMLQQAKKKIGSEEVNWVRSDAANLPFRDETFDTVFVSFCLKITPAYEKAIEEAARVLKLVGMIGVLGNHKPSGLLRLPGTILTKVLSVMAKIDFEINLREHLSKKFMIIEDRKIYGGLVQVLVGRSGAILGGQKIKRQLSHNQPRSLTNRIEKVC